MEPYHRESSPVVQMYHEILTQYIANHYPPTTVLPLLHLVPHKHLHPPLAITPHTPRRKRRLRSLSLALLHRHGVLLHHRNHERSRALVRVG